MKKSPNLLKIHIRPANLIDALDMARVRIETQRVNYRAFLPLDFLDNQTYETVAKKWLQMFWQEDCGAKCFVAEDEQGYIIGTAVCRPVMDPDEEVCKGEILVLYVLPEYQGKGIGRRLMNACVENLSERGLTPFFLWTFKEGPARRFYEAFGGILVGERKTERGGKLAIEVCYRFHFFARASSAVL